jgi:hypothetical protein
MTSQATVNARKKEVIACFGATVLPEDLHVEHDYCNRHVLAVGCIRIAERLSRTLFIHAFPAANRIAAFNETDPPLPGLLRALEQHGTGQRSIRPRSPSLDDMQVMELAKIFFASRVTNEDVVDEPYHGYALLVRVCLKLAIRLNVEYAERTAGSLKTKEQAVKTLDEALTSSRETVESLQAQLAKEREEHKVVVARLQSQKDDWYIKYQTVQNECIQKHTQLIKASPTKKRKSPSQEAGPSGISEYKSSFVASLVAVITSY